MSYAAYKPGVSVSQNSANVAIFGPMFALAEPRGGVSTPTYNIWIF